MSKFFYLILISAFVSCQNTQKTSETTSENTTGIQFFEGSFESAKAKAKAEGKLIFMDAYASWCGPCKMMKQNTFPDQKLGEFFNKKYVSVAYDMEVGEGLELAAKYPVQAYPTLLFMNADGQVLRTELGYRDVPSLMALGQEVQ